MFPIIFDEDFSKAQELNQEIEVFMASCLKSMKPVRCCCGRRTSCLCCFTHIFGHIHQMGLILAKTFDGTHTKIVVDQKKKILLDCMFFTATCEK